MRIKPWQKNILSVIVIVAGGFVLFNLAFLLAAVTMHACRIAVTLLGGYSVEDMNPMSCRYVYVIIILLLSVFIFKSKFSTLIKATYLTMPLMVILILIGLLFYQQPQWLSIIVGAAIVLATIFFFYKKKLTWQYYIATLYTAMLALYIILSGIDI